MIRASDKRSGKDGLEPHLFSDFRPAVEDSRFYVPGDGEMLFAGREVLPDGNDIDLRLFEVFHQVDNLVVRFAQTNHQPAFNEPLSNEIVSFNPVRRGRKDVQTLLVIRLRTDVWIKPGDRLNVVIEDLAARLQNDVQRREVSFEVWRENLDRRVGQEPFDFSNRLSEMVRASVGQVVSRNAGNDNVLQSQPRRRLSDALGFVRFRRHRQTRERLDGAEAAVARAVVAQNHKRRRSFLETFRAIGAMRPVANRC